MTPMSIAKDKLSADLRAVMSDIDSLMTSGAEQANGDVQALRSRLRERLEAARTQLEQAQDEVLTRAKKAATATDTYVHEHPWQIVGGAAAVGLALGVLIGRR